MDDAAPVLEIMDWIASEAYQAVVTQAGFVHEEVLDLGRRTQATYEFLLQRLTDDRSEFDAIAATEHVAGLEQTTRLCQATTLAGKFGYLLLTARKPLA